MNRHKGTMSRREILRAGVVGSITLPLAQLAATGVVSASDLPRVDEGDPQAKGLAYVHDAAQATQRKSSSDNCASCRFYTDASAPEWGPCTLFPGKAVNAAGWCNAWASR